MSPIVAPPAESAAESPALDDSEYYAEGGTAMAATLERPSAAPEDAPVRDATPDEGERMLDEAAQYYIGISGRTFLHRWRSGYYANDPDQPGVMNVASLLSFVPASRAA